MGDQGKRYLYLSSRAEKYGDFFTWDAVTNWMNNLPEEYRILHMEIKYMHNTDLPVEIILFIEDTDYIGGRRRA